MALPSGTSQVFEAVEFDSAGDVDHTRLVVNTLNLNLHRCKMPACRERAAGP